jgi:hypothetical protein
MPRPSHFTHLYIPVPNVYEWVWDPEPVWIGAENSSLPGFDPSTVHSVVSSYTDCTILAHNNQKEVGQNTEENIICKQ